MNDIVFASTLIWYHTFRQTHRTHGITDWHTHTYKSINTTCHEPRAATCITPNEYFADTKILLYRGPQCCWFSRITHL